MTAAGEKAQRRYQDKKKQYMLHSLSALSRGREWSRDATDSDSTLGGGGGGGEDRHAVTSIQSLLFVRRPPSIRGAPLRTNRNICGDGWRFSAEATYK